MFNDEYRHTSLIATLRKAWNLGEALTQRDASARTFDDLFTLETPRDPETWVTVTALSVPAWHLDEEALNKGLSGLGKNMGHGIIEHARESESSSRHSSTTPPRGPHMRTSSKSSDRSRGNTSLSSTRTGGPATQPAARPFPLCANGPRSVAGGVAYDEAGAGAAAGRPAVAAGRALCAGVEAQSGDDHVGVPGVGVDRDPSARAGAAV